MRLLVFIIILYLAYRAARYWIAGHMIRGPETPVEQERHLNDIMVKCPFCEVYFPRNSGVPLKTDGKTLYFCSQECKDNYLSKISK